MNCLKECPLQNVCDQQLQEDFDANKIALRTIFSNRQKLEDTTSAAYTVDEAVQVLGENKDQLSVMRTVLDNKITEKLERSECSGVVRERRGFWRRVVSEQCGSIPRVERVGTYQPEQ